MAGFAISYVYSVRIASYMLHKVRIAIIAILASILVMQIFPGLAKSVAQRD